MKYKIILTILFQIFIIGSVISQNSGQTKPNKEPNSHLTKSGEVVKVADKNQAELLGKNQSEIIAVTFGFLLSSLLATLLYVFKFKNSKLEQDIAKLDGEVNSMWKNDTISAKLDSNIEKLKTFIHEKGYDNNIDLINKDLQFIKSGINENKDLINSLNQSEYFYIDSGLIDDEKYEDFIELYRENWNTKLSSLIPATLNLAISLSEKGEKEKANSICEFIKVVIEDKYAIYQSKILDLQDTSE